MAGGRVEPSDRVAVLACSGVAAALADAVFVLYRDADNAFAAPDDVEKGRREPNYGVLYWFDDTNTTAPPYP